MEYVALAFSLLAVIVASLRKHNDLQVLHSIKVGEGELCVVITPTQIEQHRYDPSTQHLTITKIHAG